MAEIVRRTLLFRWALYFDLSISFRPADLLASRTSTDALVDFRRYDFFSLVGEKTMQVCFDDFV